METLTTLYRKQEQGVCFWATSLMDNNSVSITWGMVGSSLGARVKSFETTEATLTFYNAFVNRIKRSFTFLPDPGRYLVNIRVDGKLSIPPTSEQFAEYTIPLQTALESELATNGIGSVGSLKIEDHILSLPIEVVNSNIALNRIREVLAGFGIGRNRVLFLPR
jgi:hypothetical protein